MLFPFRKKVIIDRQRLNAKKTIIVLHRNAIPAQEDDDYTYSLNAISVQEENDYSSP